MIARDAAIRGVLRSLAVAIAIGGVVDPAIAGSRLAKPEVNVVAVDLSSDDAGTHRVIRALEKRYPILRTPFSAARATVLVGDRPISLGTNPPALVFAVTPDRTAPYAAIES